MFEMKRYILFSLLICFFSGFFSIYAQESDEEEMDMDMFEKKSEKKESPKPPITMKKKEERKEGPQQPKEEEKSQQVKKKEKSKKDEDEDDNEENEEEEDRGVRILEERSTRYITISGTLGVNFVFRDDFFADTDYDSTTGSTDLDSDFFDPRISLRMDIYLDNNIKGVIELQNEQRQARLQRTSLKNYYYSRRSSDDVFHLEFERAYIELGNFLKKGLTLQAGIIPLKYSLRPDGASFFMNLKEAESPFATRDDTHAAGAFLRYQPDQRLSFYAEGFYLVTSESGFGRKDESVMGVNLDLYLPKNLQDKDEATVTLIRTFNLLFAAIQRDNNSPIWTFGIGFDYFLSGNINSYMLELYGEALVQFGKYHGKNEAPSFSNRDQQHLAFGGYAGFRYMIRDSKYKPYLDVSFWYISGDDDDPDRRKNNDLVSYEDIDTTIIMEENDYGLDIDSNYWAVKVRAGLSLKEIFKEEVDLDILYAHFEAVDAPPGITHRMGEEIDIRITWQYSSDMFFHVTAGILFAGDYFDEYFDELGADGQEHAFMFRLETSMRF